MSNPHHQALRRLVLGLPLAPPPAPWRLTCETAIGGLTEVGWARDRELLLAVSSAGRGLFDAASGALIARDRAEPEEEWYDEARLECRGIGPAEGETVRIAGLGGGGLARGTADGWSLGVHQPEWPFVDVILQGDGCDLLCELSQPGRHRRGCARLGRWLDFRAAGFSETGRSLVIADSGSIRLYHRGE